MSLFGRRTNAAPRLQHFDHQTAQGRATVHLRTAPDGSAELFVNANQVFRLNPSAAQMAALSLGETPEREALDLLARLYRADPAQLAVDYSDFQHQLQELIDPAGGCPVHDLELEVTPPFGEMPSAPYRMDLALTYRCNDDCAHCYNARPRDYPELKTADWKGALDRLWDVGIPHICFTGGEATLRRDLPELISYSHERGQIVGLLSNGRRLSDRAYTRSLVQSGLDHVQITLESRRQDVHDRMVRAPGAWNQTVAGIRNALEAGLFVMTNTTLLADNAGHILETIDYLADLGVPTIGVNALIHAGHGQRVGTGLPEASLGPLLARVRARTEEHQQRLIWYTPTQYCHFDPVEAELGVKGCTAARYNMAIEPDGAVLPCQSYYQPVGNILTDRWETIWNHELSIWLRERRYMAEGCRTCALVEECGGGCPLSPLTASEAAPDWIPLATIDRSLEGEAS
ncbi:MAG TPA: radical SAM protein [Anaerolineales bacterium]|nr:radical SAM protein [Anaerolineales bacterium]